MAMVQLLLPRLVLLLLLLLLRLAKVKAVTWVKVCSRVMTLGLQLLQCQRLLTLQFEALPVSLLVSESPAKGIWRRSRLQAKALHHMCSGSSGSGFRGDTTRDERHHDVLQLLLLLLWGQRRAVQLPLHESCYGSTLVQLRQVPGVLMLADQCGELRRYLPSGRNVRHQLRLEGAVYLGAASISTTSSFLHPCVLERSAVSPGGHGTGGRDPLAHVLVNHW